METFEAFQLHSEVNEKAMECVKGLEQMEMKYGIALWKLAVRIKKGTRNAASA